MNIIFFGSTSDSVIVLEKLALFGIVAAVTQPPRPVGRKQVVTPTPVEIWAKTHDIPVVSFPHNPSQPPLFAEEQVVIDTLQPFKADLLVSASFGQKIPWETITASKFGGLNVHPSLLPRWRGADPVPWAILTGDAQTGVTIVTLSETFDEGAIIAQKKIPITDRDVADPLRAKLFTLGADLLVKILASKDHPFKGSPQDKHRASYARRLTRDDGFEPWEAITKAFEDPDEAQRIERKFRAFMPWPGLWSEVSVPQRVNVSAQKKRVKIVSLHRHTSDNDTVIPQLVLDSVQLEGKTPISFQQFAAAYLSPLPS